MTDGINCVKCNIFKFKFNGHLGAFNGLALPYLRPAMKDGSTAFILHAVDFPQAGLPDKLKQYLNITKNYYYFFVIHLQLFKPEIYVKSCGISIAQQCAVHAGSLATLAFFSGQRQQLFQISQLAGLFIYVYVTLNIFG